VYIGNHDGFNKCEIHIYQGCYVSKINIEAASEASQGEEASFHQAFPVGNLEVVEEGTRLVG
jgi:hypothetical protein